MYCSRSRWLHPLFALFFVGLPYPVELLRPEYDDSVDALRPKENVPSRPEYIHSIDAVQAVQRQHMHGAASGSAGSLFARHAAADATGRPQLWTKGSAAALNELPQAPEPAEPNIMDEHDSAPKWYVLMAVGFGAGLGILLSVLFMLHCFQVLVGFQRRYQEELVSCKKTSSNKLRSSKGGALQSERLPCSVSEQDTQEPMTSLPSQLVQPAFLPTGEAMALINGEQDRLAMLLRIDCAEFPQTQVLQVVQRVVKANKFKLSKESELQIAGGIVGLAKAAQKLSQRRESGGSSPRERLQSAMRQVRFMVRVCRALRHSLHDNEERVWTDETDSATITKHSEGSKPSAQRSVVHAPTALGAYFASERWIDHAGILLIAFYSQLCGFAYAVYLKYRFPKMYAFMGPWVLLSRGEAMSVIILTVLMVLLLTRGLMTSVRKYVGWSAVLANLIDKHALMHQWCGRMLPVCSVLHIVGHLRGSIPAIINETSNARINDAFTYGTTIKFNFNSWAGAMQSYPSVTGFGLILILVAFWSLSNAYVRHRFFELFHYPHLILVVAWCAGLWAHGARQWLGCGQPLALVAVVPAVVFYFASRVTDVMRGIHSNIKIAGAIIKSKTMLLEIETEGSQFTYSTGMYCMVNIPEISEFQWHPFTIASASGAPRVQLLLAIAGDWTKRLKELLEEAQKSGKPYPEICLRGGYGAPAEGIKDATHIVMVGAGAGATPFLSFLASVCASAQGESENQFTSIESAVFYWVSREPEDFHWVNQYSSIISATPWLRDRISVRLCLTRALDTTASAECSAAEVAMFWSGAQCALNSGQASSLASELGVPTQFGRPDWHAELGLYAKELHAKSGEQHLEIGVYACGNPQLVAALEKACDDLDDEDVTLRLFAEQF